MVKVEVADHVVPPVMESAGMACSCSTHPHPPCSYCQPSENEAPEPNQDSEFRAVIPTEQQGTICEWWEVKGDTRSVRFMYVNAKPHAWKWSHFLSAAYENLETLWNVEQWSAPIKPKIMTWKELDKNIAELNGRPWCVICHGCGTELVEINGSLTCCNGTCKLTNTNESMYRSPYYGPCKSSHPVRHE